MANDKDAVANIYDNCVEVNIDTILSYFNRCRINIGTNGITFLSDVIKWAFMDGFVKGYSQRRRDEKCDYNDNNIPVICEECLKDMLEKAKGL